MNRDDVDWWGYWAAAPTAFTADGELDEPAITATLQLYRDQGVHGVLVNGTTGEWFAQSPAERRRVAEVAVAALAGSGVPVVVGCNGYTPAETIGLAEHARSAGADGALTTPPPYVHPSDEEVLAFYRTVTEAVDLPWMVYNWPRGTAVDLPVAVLDQLADLDRVVAVKDSTGDEIKCLEGCEALVGRVRFFGRFVHPRGMAFLTGLGGDGNIDGGAVGAPFAAPFYDAVRAGDLDTARTRSKQYGALVAALVNSDYSAKFASPTAQVKAAMHVLGQPGGGHVRPPLLPLTDPARLGELEAALAGAGLTR
ncbi:dihydrodipicolinate synthase family protein [Klenkia sp. PcliD-1-E]|uniref:dihydrodipicolinate synthase family protein n=1 Tax=Klenkia sp. PcliD-1-E TaxID=2954492 RepID=UPI002096A334|nr:dihydrodipicolinate synthase family protein [Klenkia sp. PcliD-1-E]MCO7220595.1 dihydrodipicolinate synthase family protein [Klenkia sp. PcliD-1-E]